jgi:hypothetical protein
METIDIQEKLDEKLEENPEAQKYVSKLYYIPGTTTPSPDVTHVAIVSSMQSRERTFRMGVVAVPAFAVVLDSILALISTQQTAKPVVTPHTPHTPQPPQTPQQKPKK